MAYQDNKGGNSGEGNPIESFIRGMNGLLFGRKDSEDGQRRNGYGLEWLNPLQEAKNEARQKKEAAEKAQIVQCQKDCESKRRELEAMLREGSELYERVWPILSARAASERRNQLRRTWATSVFNAYYTSDGGIRNQLLAFMDFMEDYTAMDADMKQIVNHIKSNCAGNLEYSLSRLPSPPEDVIAPKNIEAPKELREMQLSDVFGWEPIGPEIDSLLDILASAASHEEKMAVMNGKVKRLGLNYTLKDAEPFKSNMAGADRKAMRLRLNHTLRDAELFKSNMGKVRKAVARMKESGSAAPEFDISKELELYRAMRELLECDELKALRIRSTPPEVDEAIVKDAETFLAKAKTHLLDRFIQQDNGFTIIDPPTLNNGNIARDSDVPEVPQDNGFTIIDPPTLNNGNIARDSDVPEVPQDNGFTIIDPPTGNSDHIADDSDVPQKLARDAGAPSTGIRWTDSPEEPTTEETKED